MTPDQKTILHFRITSCLDRIGAAVSMFGGYDSHAVHRVGHVQNDFELPLISRDDIEQFKFICERGIISRMRPGHPLKTKDLVRPNCNELTGFLYHISKRWQDLFLRTDEERTVYTAISLLGAQKAKRLVQTYYAGANVEQRANLNLIFKKAKQEIWAS